MLSASWADLEHAEQYSGSIFAVHRVADVATKKRDISLNLSNRLHAWFTFSSCPHEHAIGLHAHAICSHAHATHHVSTFTYHVSTCTHVMCPHEHAMCPHAHAMCPHAHLTLPYLTFVHMNMRMRTACQVGRNPYREPSRPQQRMRSCVCMRSHSDLACTGRWA